MSGIVPKDWKNPDFIDPNQLCADADYLEAQAENIDKWMNNQVICTKGKSKDACIEDRFNAKLRTDLQGILAGTEGVLVVKNDLVTVKVVFIPKNGKAVEILFPHDELLKAIEIL